MNRPLHLLRKRIGHEFANPDLLQQALTHRSHGSGHNERLEFLGDAVLGLLISEALYTRFDDASEGDLSRLRAQLVNGESLAGVAAELGLGGHLRLGPGELKSGGQHRASILADSLEAVLGAIFVDGGLAACRACVSQWFDQRLQQLSRGADYKDPKTRLQEYLQARGKDLPRYEIGIVSGESHARSFRVECLLASVGKTFTGTASSRRKAEQVAAEQALAYLGLTRANAASEPSP